MKLKQRIISSILLLLFMQTFLVKVPVKALDITSGTVTFADSNLEKAIRDNLEKPTGDITAADMESLEYIELDSSNITNLSGLEHATNLVALSLMDNQVKSLEPIKSLANLTEISAATNYIEDLTPLKNLTKLSYLDLNDNYIVKVDSLSGLVNLEVLGLSANLIRDISPLKSLTKLQVLDLGGNIFSDISHLSGLNNLIVLSLHTNSVKNIEPLKNMTSLQVLDLQNNNISDISVLNALKSKGAFNGTESGIDLGYNYLDLTNGSQQAAYITNLQAGGATVLTDNQFNSLTPKVILSNPEDNTSSFSVNLPITVYFDKAVVAGDNIEYVKIVGDAGKIINCSVIIDNNKVIITPNEKLEQGKNYIFQIAVGAFKSKAEGSKNDNFISTFTTATSEVNKYTVTFNSQGGSTVASRNVNYNTITTAPTAPTKTGHVFGGWYKEAESINLWNFTTDKVSADMTLYAKWTANKYSVTFNVNGGSAVQNQTVAYGNVAPKTADPTRGGYKFGGWYTDQYPHTKLFDLTNTPVTSDTTLYAKWIPTEAYIISYLNQSKETKLFGVYNMAKAVISESDLSEIKKGYYLGELAKLDSAVFTEMNKYFIDKCNTIAANPNLTDYLALVDEIDSKLNNDIDRGYFKGEMNTWGRFRVYTPEVQASIAAIGQVWTLKTADSVNAAKAAIATVQEAGSVTWLNTQLDEAVQAMPK